MVVSLWAVTFFIVWVCGVMGLCSSPYLLMVGLMFIAGASCVYVSVFCSGLLGFIIFLVYIGGIQVLFLYSLSVMPEVKSFYSGSERSSFMFMISLSFAVFLCFIFFVSGDSTEFSGEMSGKGGLNFDYMSGLPYCFIFLFMVLFLLFIMMVVCNLCNKSRAPLRAGFVGGGVFSL